MSSASPIAEAESWVPVGRCPSGGARVGVAVPGGRGGLVR
jgi:hypothetical protein